MQKIQKVNLKFPKKLKKKTAKSKKNWNFQKIKRNGKLSKKNSLKENGNEFLRKLKTKWRKIYKKLKTTEKLKKKIWIRKFRRKKNSWKLKKN